MSLRIVHGDLLEQDVEVIVNAWNRNLIPWWLLLPQGVSGAIKRQAGLAPFRELGRLGSIPLGGAVLTTAGALPYRGVIHVAGIDMLFRASVQSIRMSVRNAIELCHERAFASPALPVIGAGAGGFDESVATELIADELSLGSHGVDVVLVRYRPSPSRLRVK
jgi:O-acetyl-ADP-ribose deacetylase (regulator of RNase III)